MRDPEKPRLAAWLLLPAVLLLVSACDKEPTTSTRHERDGALDASMGVDIVDAPPLGYDLHQADRRGCTAFTAGSRVEDTIGPEVPHGSQLPFHHVVVLVQENRSFDHYLSKLNESDTPDASIDLDDTVDTASDNVTNPSGPGSPVQEFGRQLEAFPCESDGRDLNHDWEAAHIQYDDGLLDGFVVTNAPGGERAMNYYGPETLPYYYWLAHEFGIGDRNFSSLIGPTWPNRYCLLAATAGKCTFTPSPKLDLSNLNLNDIPAILAQISCESHPDTSIFDLLDRQKISWKVYTGNNQTICIGPGVCLLASLAEVMLQKLMLANTVPVEQFAADAASGSLPQVSFIEPHFGADSEHPPGSVQRGQAFVRSIVEAVAQPKSWPDTVLFVTYDEHGGYYDHVKPPPACEPDDLQPATYHFDRLGFRVPMFVISAYNKPGHVSHFVTDHTSILRFIEALFDLPAMTKRDANAWPLLDRFAIDGSGNMTYPTFPTGAPATPIAESTACP